MIFFFFLSWQSCLFKELFLINLVKQPASRNAQLCKGLQAQFGTSSSAHLQCPTKIRLYLTLPAITVPWVLITCNCHSSQPISSTIKHAHTQQLVSGLVRAYRLTYLLYTPEDSFRYLTEVFQVIFSLPSHL